MPANIGGIYMPRFVAGKTCVLGTILLHMGTVSTQQAKRDRAILFIKYSLNHYLAKQHSILWVFLVEMDMRSTGQWAESFSSITIAEN